MVDTVFSRICEGFAAALMYTLLRHDRLKRRGESKKEDFGRSSIGNVYFISAASSVLNPLAPYLFRGFYRPPSDEADIILNICLQHKNYRVLFNTSSESKDYLWVT